VPDPPRFRRLLRVSVAAVAALPAIGPISGPGLSAQNRAGSPSRTYRILPESRFEVRTGTAGLLARLADVHVIRAGAFHGTVRFAPDDVAASHVEVTVPVDSLVVETPVDPEDRAEIREAMLTEVLDARQHPEVRFRSTEVEAAGDSLRITGDLTLAGTTRPVTVTLAYRSAVGRLWAWGSFTVRQTEFGIEPYGTALGTVKVADPVRFYLETVAERIRESPEGDAGTGLSRVPRSGRPRASPGG